MTGFIEQVTSLSWWLGVVVVGILINLFTSFIKPKIESIGGYISEKLRNRNEAKKAEWTEEVDLLSEDEGYLAAFLSKINIEYLESLYLILVGVSLFLLGSSMSKVAPEMESHILPEKWLTIASSFMFLIGSIATLLGVINHQKVQRMLRKLSDASRQSADEKR